ncbi:hypothetical protein V2O64_06760 [Verrucomicrobiaceae bacterium 227]
MQFAHWMESKCGFLFICQILIGPWEKVSPRLAGAKQSIDTFIKTQGYSAASQVITAEGLDQGVTNLIEATGVGPISPNTVLMGWSEDDHKQDIYQHTVRRILLSKRNLKYRIDAETCVMTSDKPIRETIIETSKFSEITFLGINLEGGENDEQIYEEMEKTNDDLKGNIFVTRSWEDFSA